MDCSILIAVVIVLIVVLVYWRRRESFALSSLDNQRYKVIDRYIDKDIAANMLANINMANLGLIQYMEIKYLNDPTKFGSHGYKLAKRLKERYCHTCLEENDPPDKDNTSFVEDKGEVFAMCLREKQSGRDEFQDWNTVMFVAIHEMSHIASEGYGHENEFWTNFKFLLIEAREAGLYDVVDYSQSPTNYCGLDVNYNPFYDKELMIPG
jgi:hypothetical protein